MVSYLTCNWTLLWRRTGSFLLTKSKCRRWSFQCISSIFWQYLSAVDGFDRITKGVMDQTSSRLPITVTFFWCSAGFEKGCGALSWSNNWIEHRWLSHRIHFQSHIAIWFSWFSINSCGTLPSSFFNFPIFHK